MPLKLYPETSIQNIADAIREKNGSSDEYTVAEMAQAILDIQGGGGGYAIQDENGYVTLSPEGGRDILNEITITTSGDVTQAISAGNIYHFTGSLTSLTITLNATTSMAHYHFDFTSGSTAVVFSVPGTVNLPTAFQVEKNTRYEVDILNNYATIGQWGFIPS